MSIVFLRPLPLTNQINVQTVVAVLITMPGHVTEDKIQTILFLELLYQFQTKRRMKRGLGALRYSIFRATENSGKTSSQIRANFNSVIDCTCMNFRPQCGLSSVE